jgi:hypothetical protein
LLPAAPGEPAVELAAPDIDLHRITAAAVLVDAQGTAAAPARLDGELAPNGDAAGGSGSITARRIRVLPFAVGPAALLRHHLGLPRGLADAVAGGLGNPWLLAQGQVVADLADVRHGELHGNGELLAIDQSGQSALLVGDAATAQPAALRSRQPDGREATATGARLLCFRAGGEHVRVLTTFPERQVLVQPRVTLRDPRGGAGDPFANLAGECAGEIEVLPASVLFLGPVAAHSLLPDGREDPRGPRIVAQKLIMSRGQPDGAITRVQADGGVTVDWDTMQARSHWLELDLRAQRCTARDPDGAEIRFGNGRSYRARQLEANYVTQAVRSYHGQFVQDGSPISRR